MKLQKLVLALLPVVCLALSACSTTPSTQAEKTATAKATRIADRVGSRN